MGWHVFVSSEHIPIKQGYTHKLAPKWLSPFVIDAAISSVAYHVDLLLRYKQLLLVFYAS